MAQRMPLISPQRLARPAEARPLSSRAQPEIDVRALCSALERTVEGEVRFDDGSKGLYAEDASNYRHIPIGVVIPRSADDVVATLSACRAFGAPVVSRAGGTSLAGQTCNTAVVIDFSKYMNHIVELDADRRFARVEPGVICDQLAFAARPYKLTYGPDPATHSHCCFGGMLGNNSCGVHAQMAGKAVDNTEAMEVLLYDGTRMRLGWTDDREMDARIAEGGRVGEICRRLRALRDRYADEIRARFPKIPRRVSGYNLDELLPDERGRFNLARALVGSEGTCVTLLEATVRLVYNHPERVLLVLGYPDVYHAGDHIPEVLKYSPIGLEGLDRRLVENIQKKGGPHADFLPILPEGHGWLMVEFGWDTQEEAEVSARRLMADLERSPRPPSMRLLIDRREQNKMWKIRESGLGATAFVPGEPDTWPGWEDSAVAPDKVGAYLRDLRALYSRYGYNPALYGHFGMGCIHCRVDFDLRTQRGVATWKAFMEDATDLVVRYGGSFSGEHGDGQARAQYLPKMFGPELVRAFGEFKAIWDPDGKMNPGKVVDPRPVDHDLRLGAHYRPWEPETHFKYPEDGGSFAHATLRCVGIGKCRRLDGKDGDDVMCPSFMVTREEMHATRGRAHLLWEMLRDGPIRGGFRDEHVKESLDLCLACKGCKGECPVNVDIATYKAEFLSRYYQGRLRPRSAYAFGLIDRWARIASIAPGLANLVTQLPGLRAVAKLAAGIPEQREIPAFAAEPFTAWFRRRPRRNEGGPKVVLWPDTFNNYFFPETAQAAVEVLEHAGYAVEVPDGHVCCGRPLYDFGMLDRAKRYLLRVLDRMQREIRAGTPIVVLEPSCCSVFRDELHNLFPDREDAERLRKNTMLLSELLVSRGDDYEPPRLPRKAIVQGHCHHKSVLRFDAEAKLLDKLGLDWELLESGCCGMAGAFGYEKDKLDVSLAAGERALLPAVREARPSTLVLANGFSCKEQIAQSTERRALHLAEVLRIAISDRRGGEEAAMDAYPERRVIAERKRAQRRSMARAVVGVGAVIAGAVLLSSRKRRRRLF